MTELIIAVVVIRARTLVPQCIVRQMHAQCNSIWAEMIKWSALRNDYNARLFFPCQSLARVALFLFIITVFSMRDWGVVLRKCQCNLLLIVQDMYARLHSVFFRLWLCLSLDLYLHFRRVFTFVWEIVFYFIHSSDTLIRTHFWSQNISTKLRCKCPFHIIFFERIA